MRLTKLQFSFLLLLSQMASAQNTCLEAGLKFGYGSAYLYNKADLQVGDLLTAGGSSNYKSDLKMNHIYFAALLNWAGLAAGLAKGDGRERVYVVETTQRFSFCKKLQYQTSPQCHAVSICPR